MAELGADVEAISEAPSPVKRDRGGRYSADRSAVWDHFTSGPGGTNSCEYVRQCGLRLCSYDYLQPNFLGIASL